MDDEQLRDAFRDSDGLPDDAFADALEDRLRSAAAHGTVAVEMADEAELNAARRRRARGWRAVVAIGAAAALVGAVAVVRGGTHTGKATIADISKATAGTAHIETTVHETMTSGGPTDGNGSFDTTSSGDVDFTHHAARLTTHSSFFINDNVTGPGTNYGAGPNAATSGADIVALYADGHRYQSLPSAPFAGIAPTPVSLRGKHWLLIDMPVRPAGCSKTSSATSSPPAPSTSTSVATRGLVGTSLGTACVESTGMSGVPSLMGSLSGLGFGPGVDPSAVLDELRKQGATISLLGAGVVRGTTVHRYRVVVKPSSFPASIEIDVDAQNRLRRSIVTFDLAAMYGSIAHSLPKGVTPPAITGTMRVQSDLFDFGTPVMIQAPAPSEVVSMADYEKAMSASSSNPVVPQVPTKLTTPWQRIGESSDGSWSVYQGAANDWTCFAVTGTAVDTTGTPFGAGVLIGMPTQLDGKQAMCVQGSSISTLLAHLTKGRETFVGVAYTPATVTVELAKGAPVTLGVPTAGVFEWTAPSGATPTKLTIAPKGGSSITCRPLGGSDFQISNNKVTGGAPSGLFGSVWMCDAVGGIGGLVP